MSNSPLHHLLRSILGAAASFYEKWCSKRTLFAVSSAALLALILFFYSSSFAAGGENAARLKQGLHLEGEDPSCSLSDVDELLSLLRRSGRPPPCLSPVLRLLELRAEEATVDLGPKEGSRVRSMVHGWLGERADRLLPRVEEQWLLRVRNRHTGQETTFNPLRASRPLPKPERDPREFVERYEHPIKKPKLYLLAPVAQCSNCGFTAKADGTVFVALAATFVAVV